MKSKTRILWVLAAAAFAIGGVGVLIRLFTGHQHADYGSYVPWGLWVGAYVYLVWLEVGTILAFAGLVHVFGVKRLAPVGRYVLLVALAVLVGALAQIGLDLGHLGRAWRAVLTPNFRSPMSWMIWLHVGYLALLAAELRLELSRREGDPEDRRARRLSLVSIPFGFALLSVVGSVFGVTAAQPLWSGAAMPLFFLISSLVVGVATVTLIYALAAPERAAREGSETLGLLSRVVVGLVVFGLFCVAVNAATLLYPGTTGSADSLRIILGGRHSWSLWFVHLALGIAVPLFLLARYRGSRRAISAAMVLILVGFLPVPMNFIVPPLMHPEFEALAQAFGGPGLGFDYFPTSVEWLVSLWIASLVALGILLGARFLAPRREAAAEPAAPLRRAV
jgi:protein NrfD